MSLSDEGRAAKRAIEAETAFFLRRARKIRRQREHQEAKEVRGNIRLAPVPKGLLDYAERQRKEANLPARDRRMAQEAAERQRRVQGSKR